MGRGRAKAKQTKVARALKYSSGGINIEALQSEIGHAADPSSAGNAVPDDAMTEVAEDPTEADPYAKYYVADDEDEAAEPSR